jgi:predicted NBD/HSP70 family sugar kinase
MLQRSEAGVADLSSIAEQINAPLPSAERRGCGPLVAPDAEAVRPLRQQLFEAIRAAGQIARAQLARDLRVSPASVTTVTSELIDAGLIEETVLTRDGDVVRGRPPVGIAVRPGARLVAGMKISDREHTAVVVDFSGGLVADAAVPCQPGPMDLAALLDAADALLTRVTAAAGIAREDLAAVGLGVPGFVDMRAGTVLWSPVLGQRRTPLAETATRRLGLPVHIDNDANLVTLAELWFGAGRDLADFAVVTIEHGLGMGVVINHRIWRGAQGLGLELGHTKVQLDGALCRCGQRGCLEAYVADYALAREAATALNREGRGQSAVVLLESLHDHAKAGHPAARSIFRRAGRYLALGLANVVNLFDPPLIILSGERMRYDYLYAADVLAEMEELVLNAGRPAPRVAIHAWGDLLWAHGAAALALSAVTDQALGVSSG